MALNRGYRYLVQAGPANIGARVLDFLETAFAHSSRDVWAARLDRGELALDGARARADDTLRAGHTLVWQRPPWDEPEVPLHFEVVYEDDAMIAVAKPSGLPTMPAGGFLEHTLLAIVRKRYPEVNAVHRLGRHTSGLVLFARSMTAAAALSLAWRERAVTKEYRALGSGTPTWTRTTIDAPIGPVPHPTLVTVHAATAGGRPATSHVSMVEQRPGATLFDVRIETGRPHQIRVHLAYAGHSLVGDRLYAAGGVPRAIDPALPGEGGYLLHAQRLAFAHPTTGVPVELRHEPQGQLRAT